MTNQAHEKRAFSFRPVSYIFPSGTELVDSEVFNRFGTILRRKGADIPPAS